jgi:soluble epoxide hydrolase / lipid-phosphate phosphatase
MQEKAMHKEIFHDGYDGALDWYRAGTQRVNDEDEQEPGLDPRVRVPVLSILAKKDVVVAPGTDQMMKMLISELDTVEVDSGHWVQLDKRNEFNEIIKGWVEKVETGR